MGRIAGHSADRPDNWAPHEVGAPREFVPEADFLETAGRLREVHVREQAHVGRDAEIDARTLDRQEAQDYAWREPTNLDAPPPRAGMRQKWVRVSARNEMDNINWTARLRDGWVPRDPKTVPDAMGYDPITSHQNQSVIQVAGSVLCEMPIQKVKAREEWIRQKNKRLEESITVETDKISAQAVRNGHSPIQREDKIETTVGGKRRPATMAD